MLQTHYKDYKSYIPLQRKLLFDIINLIEEVYI